MFTKEIVELLLLLHQMIGRREEGATRNPAQTKPKPAATTKEETEPGENGGIFGGELMIERLVQQC